jgi:hypothetical protein
MTSLDIDAIEARANSHAVGVECQELDLEDGDEITDYDACACDYFYAKSAACEDIPALCAEVRRLREQLANALARESAERAERIAAEEARDYAEAACANSWECGKCKEAGQ